MLAVLARFCRRVSTIGVPLLPNGPPRPQEAKVHAGVLRSGDVSACKRIASYNSLRLSMSLVKETF